MMKENHKKIINIPNIFFILILLSLRLPSKYGAEMRGGLKSVHAFLFVVILIEAAFLFAQFSKKDSIQPAKKLSSRDITGFVFIVLWFWEFFVSRLNVFPYIFVPAPENVFHVFIDDYKSILLGFVSSMYLLMVGMLSALICAVVLGTIVGWNNRLCNAIYPIAKAISTVPPLIYTPYVASAMIPALPSSMSRPVSSSTRLSSSSAPGMTTSGVTPTRSAKWPRLL